jgi:hypothetical protein
MRSARRDSRAVGRPVLGSVAACLEPLEPRAYWSVDVAAAISITAPATGQVKPGQKFTVSVEIINDGAAELSNSVPVELGLSTSPGGTSPVFEEEVVKLVRLAPGAHTSFKVSRTIPAGFALGTYYAVANADPTDTLGDSNLANNLAVSARSLTVISPYPDLDATWSGLGKVTKGFAKGLKFTRQEVFIENPATGTFTFTGQQYNDDGDDFTLSGTGTITTKGVFADESTSTSATGTTSESTAKGHLGHNKLTLTFANAVDSGTLTLTLLEP